MRNTSRQLASLLLALILLTAGKLSAGASPYTPPYVFVPNTLIRSAQVNANFAQVGTIVNNLDNTNFNLSANLNPLLLDPTKVFPTFLVAATTVVWGAGTTGDTFPRIEFVSNGSLLMGSGSLAPDIGLFRINSTTMGIRNAANNANENFQAANGTFSGTVSAANLSGAAFPVTVPNGGSGVGTLTNHGVVIGQGTSPVHISSAGTAGQILVSNGAGADPTFQTSATGVSSVTRALIPSGGAPSIAPTTGAVVVQQGFVSSDAKRCRQSLNISALSDTTFTAVGTPAPSIYAGATASNTFFSGGHVTLPRVIQFTHAVAASTAGIFYGLSGSNFLTSRNSAPTFACTVQPTLAAGSYTWVGLTSGDISANGNALGAIAAAVFKFKQGTDTHWQCITSNGTTTVTVDSGITPDTTNGNSLAVDIDYFGTGFTFYIDGVQVAQTTQNWSTFGDIGLSYEISNTDSGSTGQSQIGIGQVYLETN